MSWCFLYQLVHLRVFSVGCDVDGLFFLLLLLLRGPNPTKVIQQLMALRVDQQLHIFNSLKAHLTEKGLLPALEEAAAA